ncbi:Wzz/FepE/Etk N-terminal domain-containing protein [Luminiphilus sp.]|nr:Wzz/FepE/Etk N-terminal domain-containing protein [Luminiphilus sp.]
MTEPQDRLHANSEEAFDFKHVLAVLWAGKWLITLTTALSVTFALMIALSLPNIYTARTILAPSESSSTGLGGLMQQYGGLASLAGLSLPTGGEGSRAQLGMELIKSRSFLGAFVKRHDILPELMAVKSWDIESGSLLYDPKIYDAASEQWVRKVKLPYDARPSILEAHKEFIKILKVSKDKQTGYISVSIEHQSPIVAAQWVNWLIQDVNTEVKNQVVDEATRSIDYLTQQVESTSLTDLKAMFFELIQSQTETIMLAEVRNEFVFKAIDPAVIPEEKTKPSRLLICVLGALLGGILGIAFTLSRYLVRPANEKDQGRG